MISGSRRIFAVRDVGVALKRPDDLGRNGACVEPGIEIVAAGWEWLVDVAGAIQVIAAGPHIPHRYRVRLAQFALDFETIVLNIRHVVGWVERVEADRAQGAG